MSLPSSAFFSFLAFPWYLHQDIFFHLQFKASCNSSDKLTVEILTVNKFFKSLQLHIAILLTSIQFLDCIVLAPCRTALTKLYPRSILGAIKNTPKKFVV